MTCGLGSSDLFVAEEVQEMAHEGGAVTVMKLAIMFFTGGSMGALPPNPRSFSLWAGLRRCLKENAAEPKARRRD